MERKVIKLDLEDGPMVYPANTYNSRLQVEQEQLGPSLAKILRKRHRLTVCARNSISVVPHIARTGKTSWRVSTSSIGVTVVHVCHAFVD